ncbi:right-handed parallel beta-helix repeat-containing protein [Elioraea rosea]|uniref:hypothetical protein n=1 Tax=Elioraea rosea TaxID=2492390 RepID=UPI001186B1B1|nr:hypothetical protein [Elioraea rosea]
MLLFLALVFSLSLAFSAASTTLRVGPGERFPTPSAAAAAARAGDRIVIRAGTYRDCAVWGVPDLTIEAAAEPVVITGPVCQGKALFVAGAPRLTITGLTFRGAIAPPGNGAGIRAEGGDLTIRRTRFEDNQNGILTAVNIPTATLVIEESVFLQNGALIGECAHGLYANTLALLAIRRSRFEATRICHHIKSRAVRTEIIDTEILDGPEETASYQVDIPNGGDLVLARNTVRKGPRAGNMRAAVVIGAEGIRHPTTTLWIEANRFENLMPRGTVFVRNLTAAPAVLSGNRFLGSVTPLEGPGTVR